MKLSKKYAAYLVLLLILPVAVILINTAFGRSKEEPNEVSTQDSYNDSYNDSYDDKNRGDEYNDSEIKEANENKENKRDRIKDEDKNKDDEKDDIKDEGKNKKKDKDNDKKESKDKKSDIDSKKIQKLIKDTKIVSPRNKTVIKEDTFKVEVQASEATGAEVYTKRRNSQQENYLGKLSSEDGDDDSWSLAVNPDESMPNGEYDLIVKVKNKAGEYEGGLVSVSVERTAENDEYDDETGENNNQDDNGYNIDQNGNKIKSKRFKEVKKTKLEELTKEERKLVADHDADFDHDGLTNKEEERLGTNPLLADSDNDGFLDGDEIKNGYNPLQFSPGDKSDKMIFQDPREKGEIKNEFKIKEVALIKKEVKKDNSKEESVKGENKIRLTGKALPNTFINIYIYSNAPVIVTVKTDANGNWAYELDKNLENGNHEAYVVMTDNAGKITAKSKPIYFVKTAQAITVESQSAGAQVKSPIENSQNKSFMYLLLIGVAFSGIAIIIIGIVTDRKANKKE